jgi:zinc protease
VTSRQSLRRRDLAALLAWPWAVAAGTPGVDEPPAAQPPQPVPLPPIDEQRLANGLGLVVASRPALPLVSITLLVRAGPERDADGSAGVAAMTAALLTKGARRGGKAVDAPTLARQSEALGSVIDSSSSWRASTVSMVVTRPRLEAALALIGDVVRRPLLGEAELERARAQALDALRVTMGSPGEVAGMALRRAFWGDTPYGTVTTTASLERLKLADLRRFHARWYRPDLATLILAGDVDPPHALALARRLFGDWKVPSAELPPAPRTPAAPISERLVLIDMPGSGQSAVAVAAPYVASASAERRVAQLANAVLGGGYSARLNQELRIRRGLSYGAFSDAESHPPGGMIVAQAMTHHPTAAQVLELMRAEIARLGAAPPSADELAARQATLVGSFARRLQTLGGLNALFVGQLSQGRSLADLGRTTAEILAVTPEQVQAFARKTWPAGELRAVVAGDLQAAGAGLDAAAGALRLPIKGLDLEQVRLAPR